MTRRLRELFAASLIALLLVCPMLAGDMHSDSPVSGNPPQSQQDATAAGTGNESAATSSDAGSYADAAAEVVSVLAGVLTAL
jgi:hypothetical protein